METLTSAVLIRDWGMRFGVVNGWVQFDESSKGWPKPGVSPRRKIRQMPKRTVPRFCSKQNHSTWEMGLSEV
jgi:hypothetical protein